VATSDATTVRPPTSRGYVADEYEDLYPDRARRKKLEELENLQNPITKFRIISNIQFR
jgi:hypothetical protein